MDKQILLNRIKCKSCKEILTSYHRHDFKQCKCSNETFIDGGTGYIRYGGKDLSLIDDRYVIYLSTNHLKNRHYAYWGTRGKNGKSSLKYKSIASMSNAHIENVIKDLIGVMPEYLLNIMSKELKYRKTHNIIIEDGK